MKKTVLIIDDEESVLEFLSGLVDSMGCRAICSRSADAARKFLPECDMVLSDIRIGFENGIEFLQSLRKQGIEKPFLFMSGSYFESETEKSIELTGYPVLLKLDIIHELPGIINALPL